MPGLPAAPRLPPLLQLLAALIKAKEQANPAGWLAFQTEVSALKLQASGPHSRARLQPAAPAGPPAGACWGPAGGLRGALKHTPAHAFCWLLCSVRGWSGRPWTWRRCWRRRSGGSGWRQSMTSTRRPAGLGTPPRQPGEEPGGWAQGSAGSSTQRLRREWSHGTWLRRCEIEVAEGSREQSLLHPPFDKQGEC